MFKKTLLRLFYLLMVLLLLISAFVAHEWYAKPFFINNFFDRFALKIVLNRPEDLTSLHFLESYGIRSHNSQLNDASVASTEEFYRFLADEYEVLKSYDDEKLNDSEKLSKKIAEYFFEMGKATKPFRFHYYPVNQLFGVQSDFPLFMDSQHQIDDLRDAQDYIKRLQKLPTKMLQILVDIKYRTQKEIIPPKFVVERVVTEMTNFSQTLVKENILYQSFNKKLEMLDNISAQEKTELLKQVEQSILQDVYPAYVTMTDYFKGLADIADNSDGIWKLPQGEEAYRMLLKYYTSTDYSPEYIHKIGLHEVTRIQQEILAILKNENFDVSQGFEAALKELSSQERFYYEDSDKGRQQILADYQKIIDEITQNVDDAFDLKAKAKVKVERIPLFKEKNSPGGYYSPPAVDGSRPGIFYANLYDIKATPKYSMKTLAYHETIPGYHFQISVAQELEGLPLFRKFAPFTAYVEGWALYAERLAWELGFVSDPYDNIGRLQAELFRAVRLVVDTGIHKQRWTRQQAIDYMMANTGMALSDVTAEVERYIVMPGQACAYKVGMMKILELREKAKRELGNRFSLIGFHRAVLSNGAVPLDVLEELVDSYIAKSR